MSIRCAVKIIGARDEKIYILIGSYWRACLCCYFQRSLMLKLSVVALLSTTLAVVCVAATMLTCRCVDPKILVAADMMTQAVLLKKIIVWKQVGNMR